MANLLKRIDKRAELHGLGPDAQILQAAGTEIRKLHTALDEIIGMFRETEFGTTELDLPNYEVLAVARAARS